MKPQFDIPILFIVFNRPDTTAIVFQRIREMRPAKLFVAADGPRTSREGEKEKCEAVRKLILSGIDWDCDLQCKFSDVNLGCGKAESSAMLWFFEATGEGIVIEDDTLPDSTFFSYCKELLATYRDDHSVRMIGGTNFQNGRKRGDGSYYFSNVTHSWGYASWWRAWKDYNFELDNISKNHFEQILNRKFKSKKLRNYWRGVYQKFKTGVYDTWDYQFLFNMWMHDGTCIIPNKNLVTNLGFGNNATHTTNVNDPSANRPLESISEIVHPNSNKINEAAEVYLYDHYWRTVGVWEKLAKKVTRLLLKIRG